MLDTLTPDSFLPHVGTVFRLRAPGGAGTLDLALVSAQAVGSSRRSGAVRERAFSVVFLGPAGAPILPQATYRLEHEEMGALDLFLVPVGIDGGRAQYEAVFN